MDCPKCGTETIVEAQYVGSLQIQIEIICNNEDCDFKVEKEIDVDEICQA